MKAELLSAIESPKVSALVNVASGYDAFLRALTAVPEVGELLGEMRSPDDTLRLSARLQVLANEPFDPEYENPHDVALAAYLWVLHETDAAAGIAEADCVCRCAGCWWATKLAERLLMNRGPDGTPPIGTKETPQTLHEVAIGAAAPL